MCSRARGKDPFLLYSSKYYKVSLMLFEKKITKITVFLLKLPIDTIISKTSRQKVKINI